MNHWFPSERGPAFVAALVEAKLTMRGRIPWHRRPITHTFKLRQA